MPLSEHEQRLLEQMERALYAEDPKLASTLRGSDLRHHQRRRIALGTLGVVAGLALLLAGVTLGWGVGLAGFLLMLVSAWWIMGAWRSGPKASSTAGQGSGAPAEQLQAKRAKAPRAGMMDRFEERWRRRREGDQR